MMKWGRNKPVSSSSSSWFSMLSGSSDLKPAKENKKKKQDDEASKNMSAKSSTKHRNDIHESSKRFQRMSIQKENTTTRLEDMESNEKFEEIMRSVKKKVRELQIETCGFAQVEGIMIMTPRCERRDQRLLEPKLKRSEQVEAKVKTKKPTTRTCTETKQAHQWQKLKETKLREVKLKADQQRKSLYIRRELNGLGTKEKNKVKVFSPRASEKFRVKAIEDLKKAKLRAKEHKLMVAIEDGGAIESESFAVVKCSSDPYKDFRDSMIEMIMENGINHPEELKELLVCYLKLNTDEYHDMIIKVFQKVHNDLNFHYFDAEE